MSTHIPLEIGKTWTFFHFRKIKVHQMFASNTGCPAILFFNHPQEQEDFFNFWVAYRHLDMQKLAVLIC